MCIRDRLYGDAAMRRVLTVFRYAAVTAETKNATVTDLMNSAAYTTAGVQEVNLLKVVRDVAENLRMTPDNLNFVTQHIAELYVVVTTWVAWATACLPACLCVVH